MESQQINSYIVRVQHILYKQQLKPHVTLPRFLPDISLRNLFIACFWIYLHTQPIQLTSSFSTFMPVTQRHQRRLVLQRLAIDIYLFSNNKFCSTCLEDTQSESTCRHTKNQRRVPPQSNQSNTSHTSQLSPSDRSRYHSTTTSMHSS